MKRLAIFGISGTIISGVLVIAILLQTTLPLGFETLAHFISSAKASGPVAPSLPTFMRSEPAAVIGQLPPAVKPGRSLLSDATTSMEFARQELGTLHYSVELDADGDPATNPMLGQNVPVARFAANPIG